MLPFKATDSSMVEGDCQIQMGRFISFLQVTVFYFPLFVFFKFGKLHKIKKISETFKC